MLTPEDKKDMQDMDRVKGAPALAVKKARMYGTSLAVKRNGKVELETPDEFERHLAEDAGRVE